MQKWFSIKDIKFISIVLAAERDVAISKEHLASFSFLGLSRRQTGKILRKFLSKRFAKDVLTSQIYFWRQCINCRELAQELAQDLTRLTHAVE